jgi:hypothetical protein
MSAGAGTMGAGGVGGGGAWPAQNGGGGGGGGGSSHAAPNAQFATAPVGDGRVELSWEASNQPTVSFDVRCSDTGAKTVITITNPGDMPLGVNVLIGSTVVASNVTVPAHGQHVVTVDFVDPKPGDTLRIETLNDSLVLAETDYAPPVPLCPARPEPRDPNFTG